MFKVFAFLKRNRLLLTHDEYRAGHVGFHCCNSRRLKNIRGYLVNIWSNETLQKKMGKKYKTMKGHYGPNEELGIVVQRVK